MKISIQITRTAEFCSRRALATGENQAEQIMVTIETKDLSARCRAQLLEIGRGHYMSLPQGIAFDRDYAPHPGNSYVYGAKRIVVDSDNPTVQEMENAISTSMETLRIEREAWHAKETAAKAEAEANRLARLEQETKLKEAKVLLAKELQLMEKYKKDRDRLGSFLARFSDEELRAVVNQLVDESRDTTVSEFISAIEDSTSIRVFGDEE
jgi:hypothetical protein